MRPCDHGPLPKGYARMNWGGMDGRRCREIMLPAPPSVNNLFVHVGRGKRARSKVYEAWINEARIIYADYGFSKPLGLKACWIEITANLNFKRDLSNILKPMEDLLQRFDEIIDDRYVERIELTRC